MLTNQGLTPPSLSDYSTSLYHHLIRAATFYFCVSVGKGEEGGDCARTKSNIYLKNTKINYRCPRKNIYWRPTYFFNIHSYLSEFFPDWLIDWLKILFNLGSTISKILFSVAEPLIHHLHTFMLLYNIYTIYLQIQVLKGVKIDIIVIKIECLKKDT